MQQPAMHEHAQKQHELITDRQICSRHMSAIINATASATANSIQDPPQQKRIANKSLRLHANSLMSDMMTRQQATTRTETIPPMYHTSHGMHSRNKSYVCQQTTTSHPLRTTHTVRAGTSDTPPTAQGMNAAANMRFCCHASSHDHIHDC
jgi:hypothetical protein